MWLTESVPPYSKVINRPRSKPEYKGPKKKDRMILWNESADGTNPVALASLKANISIRTWP